MRILYHHRTMADGAEGIHIREIVSALRALGHEVLVVALAGDPTQPTAARTSRVGTVRRLIPSAAYEVAELAYNVVGERRILRAAREFRPDVIYDRYNTYSTAALNAARRLRVPLLLEVNAPMAYERSEYEHLRLKFPALAQSYERRIMHGADHVFAVSTPLKEHLVNLLGVSADVISVLPNGADPVVFAPRDGRDIRRRYGIDDRIVIGFVGILRPWHGVDLLLDAFAGLRGTQPAAHLLIVGDGPSQTEVVRRASALGVSDALTFTGRLPHSAVVDHIAAMDLAISPQATFYASPMKILEYMSMAKAVIAPDMPNIRDIVVNGETGILFDPGSATSLTAATLTVAGDTALRSRLGRQARADVLARFTWRHNAAAVIQRVRSLTSSR